jgi:hypothetical protein
MDGQSAGVGFSVTGRFSRKGFHGLGFRRVVISSRVLRFFRTIRFDVWIVPIVVVVTVDT